jgi:hypothetical protein
VKKEKEKRETKQHNNKEKEHPPHLFLSYPLALVYSVEPMDMAIELFHQVSSSHDFPFPSALYFAPLVLCYAPLFPLFGI